MPIDNSIQFNGHNSYRVTETVFCHPFGVQGMDYVTHSFYAYAASALGAATRARTRFFKADGSIAGTTDHAFAVAAIFTQVDITVAVPADSVLCQVSFLTSGTWWIAEPKSEEGQTATPYNTNYQGQLSMITPDGAYLGMLTTSQIVVAGTLADPTEALDARLVTINNNAINLSSTVSGQGSRLTLIEAGQITISGSATYAAGYDPTTKETPAGAQAKVNALAATLGDLAYEDLVEAAKLGTTIIVGGYIKTGLVSASNINVGTLSADRIAAKAITGAKLADGTIGTLQIAASAITAVKIAANTITADKIDVTNLGVGKLINLTAPSNQVTLTASGSGQDVTFYSAITGYDPAKRMAIQTLGSTAVMLTAYVKPTGADHDVDGVSTFGMFHGTSGIYMSDPSKLNLVYIALGDKRIGIDATGFYKTTDSGSTKTYF